MNKHFFWILTIFGILLIVLCSQGSVSAEDSGTTNYSWAQATNHAPFSTRYSHTSVVFHNKIWVIGGLGDNGKNYNDVWSSSDGVSWTQETAHAAFSPRHVHRSVVFDDKIWVIGGRDGVSLEPLNDVWFSSDGITWQQTTPHAPFVPRWDFGCTVFNNKMWVIGGSQDGIVLNDVWFSSDGVNWKEAVKSAPFSPRMNLAATTYQDKIWVTGGFDWKHDFNDVWSSVDGVSWTQVTPNASFSARRYHNFLTDDTCLLVVGGVQDYSNIHYKDIWMSTDGKTWEKLGTEGNYTKSYGQSAVMFKGKIWMIPGTDGASDIWYFPNDSNFFPLNDSSYTITHSSDLDTSGVTIQKNISPISIKLGKPVNVSIIVVNVKKNPIHDIQVLDKVIPEFTISRGTNQGSFDVLDSNQSLNISYSIIFGKAGNYRLGEASILYADNEGEYHLAKSNDPQIQVIAPILIETPGQASNGLENNKILSDIGKILTGFFY